MAVPRRKVDPKFESRLAAGVGDFTHDIALSAPPRTALDGVIRIASRPKAKPIVMLRGKDQAVDACVFANAYPLASVKLRGVENRGSSVPSPAIGKRVDGEVNDVVSSKRCHASWRGTGVTFAAT